MKTEIEVMVRMMQITQLLKDKQDYPLNSWPRRMLVKEYKILHWVRFND